MNEIRSADGIIFDATTDVVIIGAGAAGLVAALRARLAGADVLVLEREAKPAGSTALSAGLIPAAGTCFQAKAGIADSTRLFCADIMAKAHNEANAAAVIAVVETIGPAIEWLSAAHDFPFSVIENFSYPGHSAHRMHGLPSRSGAELMDRLRSAAELCQIDIVTNAHANCLYADAASRIHGVGIWRPDGSTDRIGCKQLVLASNGYGGNPKLVSQNIPEMQYATYFGHPGNQGEALVWGKALGAQTSHLSGYQGHGSVAHPHGILITWATITEGGFQVNANGSRFCDEARGYSEAAAAVLSQPGGTAWTIFDARIADIASQFEDFRNAQAMGAIIHAPDLATLAGAITVPVEALQHAMESTSALRLAGEQSNAVSCSTDMLAPDKRAKDEWAKDEWGRKWSNLKALSPPFCAVRVTGALFHTQGGLVVDGSARVLHENGQSMPNLYAAGGAAVGVSGSQASGYLSGNGLLTAIAYGYLAGDGAAHACRQTALP